MCLLIGGPRKTDYLQLSMGTLMGREVSGCGAESPKYGS